MVTAYDTNSNNNDDDDDDDDEAIATSPPTTTSTLLQQEDSSDGCVIDKSIAEEILDDDQSLPGLKEESHIDNNSQSNNSSKSSHSNNNNNNNNNNNDNNNNDNRIKTTVMGDEVLHDSTKMFYRPVLHSDDMKDDDDDDTLADHLGAQEFVKQMVNSHHQEQQQQQQKEEQQMEAEKNGETTTSTTNAFRVSQISDLTTDGVRPSTTATTTEANQRVSAWSSFFPFPSIHNNKTLHHNSQLSAGTSNTATDDSPSMNRPIFPRPSGRGILGQQRGHPHNHHNNNNHHHQQHQPTAMRMIQQLRQSRFSQTVSVAVATAGQTLSQVEQQAEAYMDPQKTHSNTFASHVLYLFGSMQIVTTFLLVTSTGRYPTWWATIPMFLLAMMGLVATVHFTESLTRGERLFTVVGCWTIWSLSGASTYVATNACTHCVYYWAMDTMSSSPKWNMGSHISRNSNSHKNNAGAGGGGGDTGEIQQPRPTTVPSSRLSMLWDLLTSPSAAEPNSLVGSCRPCVSSVVRVMDYFFPQTDLDEQQRQLEEEEQENSLFADISPYQTASSMFGDLASWYLYHNNRTKTKYLERFNRKIVRALSDEGHFNDEALAEALTEFLCSPASRLDNPDPNLYLADLTRPRFTGEQELNISASALQSIMRGDPLRKMGVTVCFMLRFALMVPKDYELEHKPIQYTQLKPSMNEEGMRSKDYSSGLPFLITPGRDQDIDYDSVEMDRFGAIMDIFVRLPSDHDLFFFDTKQEYYAFYRWEYHGTFQDEFYFPSWYYLTDRADQMADFRAKRTKVSRDHLALLDPYSDKTLGDRCFYGAGQRFLTPIKLPGIDEDYEYFFPSGPHSYLSQEHRDTDFFRYPHKPRSQDLMAMIENFWPNEAKRKKRKNDLAPLARFKKRILEIDFAVFASLPSRDPFEAPGVILYLDPQTKLPMGIWKSSTREMILPYQGVKWEHAKFYYRVTERAAVATAHVAESHFGWSQPVATATWQTFHVDHPLRSMLKPYTLNVHSVNSAAYHMLVREAAILTHGSSFTTEGVIGTMTTVWSHFNFSQTIPEFFDSRRVDLVMDTEELPLFSQAKRLNTVHRRFVERFIDLWYPTDQDLLKDDSVVRFWNHVNTYGRHIDPCVCGMPSDLFFDDNDVWPGFETTRTCKDLLDIVGFETSKNEHTRRREWCSNTDRYQKAQAVVKMNQQACDVDPKCKKLWWATNSLKPDMELTELKSKAQFADFIATFIWHVTAGHKLNSDNIHAFSDAEYSGVRMPQMGPDGDLSRISDVGSYIFGSSVGLLTSVRCPPLMADWMPLYSHLVAKQSSMTSEVKDATLKTLEDIHNEYKFALLDLAVDFLDESSSQPQNRQSNTMNPACHASSVSV